MENIDDRYDRTGARAELDGIERVQQAVRDTPWPAWLYPVNAALLGLLGLSMLLDGIMLALVVVALGVVTLGLNTAVGRRIGTPWVVPTSRAFRAGLAVSMVCLAGAFVLAELEGPAWTIVVLAVLAALSYMVGALPRLRSDGR